MSAYRQGYLHLIPKAPVNSSIPPGYSYEPIYVGGEPVTTVAGDVLLGLVATPA